MEECQKLVAQKQEAKTQNEQLITEIAKWQEQRRRTVDAVNILPAQLSTAGTPIPLGNQLPMDIIL